MLNLCSPEKGVSIATQLNLVVLAPPDSRLQSPPGLTPASRNDLIARMQHLRGRIYLQDGAIEKRRVRDGRHRLPEDARSWHLLVEDSSGEIRGCVRVQIHNAETNISKLAAYRAVRSMGLQWGTKCRNALHEEMKLAQRLRVPLLEVGGLALDEKIRGSLALIKMAGGIQRLAGQMGGAIGIGTVTCRHNTSLMLRRLGGRSLETGEDFLPSYYDPQYRCEMEILKFYSWAPSSHLHRYLQNPHLYSPSRAMPRRLAVSSQPLFTTPA